MKIITVIPLSKGIFKETLTYFTSLDIEPGAVITVPVRKKKIDALVVGTENLSSSKGAVKSSAFSLKKIDRVKGERILPEIFLKSAFKIKDYVAASGSAVLSAILPKIFLESYEKLEITQGEESAPQNNLKQEKLVLQNSPEERMSFYKTFIRESFARRKSVFITLPTINDIELFHKSLSRGIENYTFVFHNEIKKKQFIASYNALGKVNHPVLIIATVPYLFLLNRKFEAVIVERESASAYKMPARPYLDMRTWAEILAREYGIKIIFADTLLRMETLWRAQNYELAEAAAISFRLSKIKREIVDMKKNKTFAVLSAELRQILKETVKSGGRSFLFAHRKGLSSITICNDCQTPIFCENCGKPLVLYESEAKKRFFMCRHCRHKKDALVTCNTCQSWNLRPLGIGCDLVYEEVRKEFPKAHVFRIDKENIKSAKEAEKTMADFYKTPGAILVGTEMALYYLTEKIENTAVVSFDSLFGIPNFKINEKIMHILLLLEAHTKESVLIQTRNKDEDTLSQFLSGNLSEFARQEIKSREEFNYPPFFTPIKIIYRGPKVNLEKTAAYLENFLKEYNPSVFRAFVPKMKNDYILNTVLKVKRENWSLPEIALGGNLDPKLLAKLQILSPHLSVQVDPDDLL